VYFPGTGWQGFDPTASVPLAGESAINGAGAGALAYLNARISIPAWVMPAIGLLVAAAGLVFLGVRLVRRGRERRRQVPPSWAATRLVRLDALGARRGRARAPGETTPEYARALTALDPLVAPELDSVARILDAAMFSDALISTGDRATVDAALALLEARWRSTRRAREPELVRT
jgi:hypothetical protein